MIFNIATLHNKFPSHKNIIQKIQTEIKNKRLYRIKRNVYSDDIEKDCLVLANYTYGPSYISFEYALYYYDLIPEHVNVITSAVYNKNKNKTFLTAELSLEYRHVPKDVFNYCIDIVKNESGINYRIATKEKALCDELYSKYPVRSIKDLEIMLYEDLRIDKEDLKAMDLNMLIELAPMYHSNTLNVFSKYIKEYILNE